MLAHAHLRLGSLALARTELETLAGLGRLDTPGLVDLAEVRWRTGDLAGAGEAAAVALRGDEEHPVALLIAAEAAAALGRPSESRRLAARAMANATGSIDAIFAGMPRSAAWPPDADEPPPTAPTLFDRAPDDARPEPADRTGRCRCIDRRPGGSRGRARARPRTDDARPVGGRRAGGAGRARSSGAGPRARGRTNRPRGREVRRGHPAFRARAAARPGARPGRPRGDGGLTRLGPADGPRRCIPAGRSRGRGQGGISRRRARRAAGAPPPLANEARQDRADRRRRWRRQRPSAEPSPRPRRRARRRSTPAADTADDGAPPVAQSPPMPPDSTTRRSTSTRQPGPRTTRRPDPRRPSDTIPRRPPRPYPRKTCQAPNEPSSSSSPTASSAS